MLIQDANEAIKWKRLVVIKNHPEKWGLITSLSDDESLAYFQPKGCGFTKIGVPLEEIELETLPEKEFWKG